MPNKKKKTTGLLVAVTPVAFEERDKKYGGGLLEDDRERYAECNCKKGVIQKS
jgi:hypothetical protein